MSHDPKDLLHYSDELALLPGAPAADIEVFAEGPARPRARLKCTGDPCKDTRMVTE